MTHSEKDAATVARVTALAEHWRANASRFSDDPDDVETWRDAALLLQEALDDHADHAAWPRPIPPGNCNCDGDDGETGHDVLCPRLATRHIADNDQPTTRHRRWHESQGGEKR